MFEKDAEEYRKNFRYYQVWHEQVVDKSPSTIVEQSFQDGAEFGYNKANEWHYPSKGEYPKDDMCEVVIITPSGEWEKGIFRKTECECYWRIIGFNENVNVIAWKEIVLPKESV